MKYFITKSRNFYLFLCATAFLSGAHTSHAQKAQTQWVQTKGPYTRVASFAGDFECLASTGNYILAGIYANGLILSSDNGAMWNAINNGLSGQSLYVNMLLISGGNIYAGTGGGLFLSKDSGANWNQVHFDSSNDDVSAIILSGGNLIVGTSGGAIYFSTDSGINWTLSSGLIRLGIPAIYCFATVDGAVFAGKFPKGLYVSNNSGVSWTLTDTALGRAGDFLVKGDSLFAFSDNGTFLTTNGGGSWSPLADIGLSDTTYLTSPVAIGQSIFAGTNSFAGTNLGFLISTNSGLSWTPAQDSGLTGTYFYSLLEKDGSLYAGTDRGIFRSTNNGTNWSQLIPMKMINSYINSLDTIGGSIFACTKTGLFSSIDSGANWIPDTTGMGALSVSSITKSGSNLVAGTDSGIFISTNMGVIWSIANGGIYKSAYVNNFVVSGGNLFAGTSQGIFLSTNNGVNWTARDSNLTLFTNVTNLGLIGNSLIAITEYVGVGTILYSTDNGVYWNYVENGPPDAVIDAFAIYDSALYCWASGFGMYVSTDTGNDWNPSVSLGIPDEDITSLIANGGNLYASTSAGGVLFFNDKTTEWIPLVTGLNNFPDSTDVITLVVSGGCLYAGTSDSGVWYYPLTHDSTKSYVAPSSSQSTDFLDRPLNLTAFPDPSHDYVSVNIPDGDGIREIHSYDIVEREVYPTYVFSSGQLTLDVRGLPDGTYFTRISGTLGGAYVSRFSLEP